MKLDRIPASTHALLAAALLILGTGTYTDNRGFQLAGVLVLVAGLLLAYRQATRAGG